MELIASLDLRREGCQPQPWKYTGPNFFFYLQGIGTEFDSFPFLTTSVCFAHMHMYVPQASVLSLVLTPIGVLTVMLSGWLRVYPLYWIPVLENLIP